MKQVMPSHVFSLQGATCSVHHANKGEGLPMHSHIYDHTSVCVSGSCVLRKDGKELVINKYSQPVLLTAPNSHEIESLEDGTCFVNMFVMM